jgi:hypothetical protein
MIALASLAAGSGAQNGAAPSSKIDELARLSLRLQAGDAKAIDELLACTPPASADAAPSSAELERLRLEVERLRNARPAAPIAKPLSEEERPADAHDPSHDSTRDFAIAVREARAWFRAGDPNHSLKVLPAGEGEALYVKACALERIGRDPEALDAFRKVAASTTSPLLKMCAASGVEHLEWRLRRAGLPEAKP